jgi:hypothetical protein
MIAMYVARVICSDPECAERTVAEAEDVLDLVWLMCECGCSMQLVGLPDFVDERATPAPLLLRPRRPLDGLDLAA